MKPESARRMRRAATLVAAGFSLAVACSAAAERMAGMGQNAMSAAVREPNAYADGYGFGLLPRPRLGGEQSFGSLLADRLEWVHTAEGDAAAYDLEAWYGRDDDRAVLKAEGDVDRGRVQTGHAELLWGHAVTPFWDAQIGVRNDQGAGPDRTWLALGVQGLAPYWVEVDATVYVGEAGREALRLKGEYELLFTQRLILQPRLEMNLYSKRDAARGLGAGVGDLVAGVRLRYEMRREFAPYVGLEWARRFGAGAVTPAGVPAAEARAVAGVRVRF